MTSNDKNQQVTVLGRESKILLLTILKQGYITDKQKQEFSNLLEVETYRMVYVTKREDYEEIERLYKEIEDEKERKEIYKNHGYVETHDLSREAIKDAMNQ